ncbi:hypothetical protein B0H11DRAFT_2047375 [Mycena galericulata]|nr:hypothetical protein B0H11DRAFT_2047375 [Mycena galericulata]
MYSTPRGPSEQNGSWRTLTIVDGGTGGIGGKGHKNGGNGGDGDAPQILPEHVQYFSKIGAGTGGAGGEGMNGNGGSGGSGEALRLDTPSLVTWEPGSVDGKEQPIPIKKVAVLCKDYGLNKKIVDLIHQKEYKTVGGLLEASTAELVELRFSKPQINEIKAALKAFLKANGAVVKAF